MPKLTFFSCGNLNMDSSLIFKGKFNLSIFSCGDLKLASCLSFPEEMSELTTFACGNVSQDVKVHLSQVYPKLIKISFGEIRDKQTQKKFKELQSNLKSFA